MVMMSPGWRKDQYQTLQTELELYNVSVKLYDSPKEAEQTTSGFWLYHGLAGPYHQLYTPEHSCGLILLGVPTQISPQSQLPEVLLPHSSSAAGVWLDDWREDGQPLPLPNISTLVLSSAKDYLAPPEFAYRHEETIDFLRFSPVNALPEPSHQDFPNHPQVARLIGRWIQDHPCSF